MPELPEVETVVRDLRPLIGGRRITSVTASAKPLRSPWRTEWSEMVVGKRIKALRRRGKWIIIELSGGDHLLAHLGMTGQLCVSQPSAPRESHTHLTFGLGPKRELRFRDVRRFGSMQLVPRDVDIDALVAEKLGPEPWDVAVEQWHHDMRRSRRSLKAILLDQTMIAGVGNIYADESLFVAQLQPSQRGEKTTRVQAERLRSAIVRVLDQAIAARGSTIRDYVGGSGLRGRFQVKHQVYGRTGKPCSVCGALIRCTRLAGRSTHWCPDCQRPRRARK
jgi:formamidopyrimidine-DNA glycosylase